MMLSVLSAAYKYYWTEARDDSLAKPSDDNPIQQVTG